MSCSAEDTCVYVYMYPSMEIRLRAEISICNQQQVNGTQGLLGNV